jgi:hypothetical protein
LLADGVKPDFEAPGADADAEINYLHRRSGETEIYFIANRAKKSASIRATFRVSGKAPELWDAVSGARRFLGTYSQAEGRTVVPITLPPCGSAFVVFREPAMAHPPVALTNDLSFALIQELNGPWTVAFDPKWGGPESATFDRLTSWTERTEPGIKFYSGTAVYRKTISLRPGTASKWLWLDLGTVHELAEVRVNGQSCGITWSPPFRVNVSRAIKPGPNQVEIEVVNFWPNRIIGDDRLPRDQRLTRTNIRKLTSQTPLMESGLLGPVALLEQKPPEKTGPDYTTQ